jgi:carbon-monoxide dehydrogenase medium subunit
MKRLKPFLYFEPASLSEALRLLADQEKKASPLAGGTDLLVRMKRGNFTPAALVNLKRIPGLDIITRAPTGGVRIGALAPLSAIQSSPLIRSTHPLLAQAASLVASPSIRNLATLGGNIGRASPASDMAPALMVLQAVVAAEGPGGQRELGIEEFFTGPGTTCLASGEVITSFVLPEMMPHAGAAYLRLGRREGMECALVGAAAFLALSGGADAVREARIALASVAPVPLRAKRAEATLLSGPLSEARMKEAARAAAEESSPVTDMRASAAYRKAMVQVMTYRALRAALHTAQGRREAP